MKKLLIFSLSFLFIFASSASAAIYRWVDEKGVVNFTDDYSKVPPDYRNKVEEVNITKIGHSTPSQTPPEKIAVAAQPREVAAQAPPIAQTLIREGDFAVKLAEALKIGQAKSEAEAENMLASVGITPKNGWIADYPVTPDVIGELQNGVGLAVDSGKLAMNKDETIKALQDLTAQQGLPVRPDTESQYAGAEPRVEPPPGDYGEYSNYYYNEGPPIVTYYPPPWDYYYLYAWVPYPFWCSGFWFPGFFCLHDFHRFVFVRGRRGIISNHFTDPKTRGVVSVNPATRGTGSSPHTVGDVSPRKGLTSPQAVRGAASIFERSQGDGRKLETPSHPGLEVLLEGRPSQTGVATYRALGGELAQEDHRQLIIGWGGARAGIGSRNMGGSSFSRQGGFDNRSGSGSGSSTGGRSSGGFHGGSGTGSRGSSGGGSRGR